MKRIVIAISILLMLGLTGCWSDESWYPDTSQKVEVKQEKSGKEEEKLLHERNQVYVKVNDGVEEAAVDALAGKYNCKVQKTKADLGIYLLISEKELKERELSDLIEEIDNESIVMMAGYNYTIPLEK